MCAQVSVTNLDIALATVKYAAQLIDRIIFCPVHVTNRQTAAIIGFYKHTLRVAAGISGGAASGGGGTKEQKLSYKYICKRPKAASVLSCAFAFCYGYYNTLKLVHNIEVLAISTRPLSVQQIMAADFLVFPFLF